MSHEYSIAIHGGAGAMSKGKLSLEQEDEIKAVLQTIIAEGLANLKEGQSALDVVQKAVNRLEDCPWFNAGKGAVFNHEGKHELDAAIMCGKTLDAGAISGIRFSPNPIDVARSVMDNSPHVYLGGVGAEQFVRDHSLPEVDNDYFSTDMRFQQLQSALKTQSVILEPTSNDYKFGTVGAVAKDRHGNLAAATSTGGITNKEYGRIGDTPVIGSGTYANNSTCAVSATGHGEHFLRHVIGYNISARMALAKENLESASKHVVFEDLLSTGGSGGLIAVDSDGNITLPFNTEGMYRGWGTSSIPAQSLIYEE
ncbi:isoaspartyl peptidase/L-asparaginase family protein [Vibrio toranzoniae]|uniref:isoaspartyl peptidase/L-asparaginase family protein n=1 Tax=Vibrio toranzoniae TaxID=1194427 RepID=UPI0013773C4E|nr:isoaspartyl peptidase/L-asparaginase [Vibrio toranzoniae]NAZ96048.1 beta-aspartyl-peptidase [Vibrio toranzoniae]